MHDRRPAVIARPRTAAGGRDRDRVRRATRISRSRSGPAVTLPPGSRPRRRPGHRPVGDARRRGGRGGPDRPRERRCAPRGPRHRGAGTRPRPPGRRRRAHRGRRADAGRRRRAAAAALRAHDRQPHRGRARDRRRAPGARDRGSTSPSSSGAFAARAGTSESRPPSSSGSSRSGRTSTAASSTFLGDRRPGRLGRRSREYARHAPDAMSFMLVLERAGADAGYPDELVGRPDRLRRLQPQRRRPRTVDSRHARSARRAETAGDDIGSEPYLDVQTAHDLALGLGPPVDDPEPERRRRPIRGARRARRAGRRRARRSVVLDHALGGRSAVSTRTRPPTRDVRRDSTCSADSAWTTRAVDDVNTRLGPAGDGDRRARTSLGVLRNGNERRWTRRRPPDLR